MSITTWNPLSELDTWRQQMDRIFHQMMGQGRPWPGRDGGALHLPSVDVYTNGKEVVVSAELPGMSAKDLSVELSPRAVYIAGESRRDDDVHEENYLRRERIYGRFERSVSLPYDVKDQEATARFKDGVLTIQAPLAEPLHLPQPRRLRVEA